MQAIILCGGRGTRLSALYPDRPKALVPVSGRPFIAWQINWLLSNRIAPVVLAAGYMGDKIRDWTRRQRFKVPVKVVMEPIPLGTGGALKFAAGLSEQKRFLVLNGDSLLPNLNFQDMATAHTRSKASGTIAVTTSKDSGRYGTVLFDRERKVKKFDEKKSRAAGWINAGIYLLERSILSAIETDKNISIENEVFPGLAMAGNLAVFQVKPPLLDMGTPEGLRITAAYLRRAKRSRRGGLVDQTSGNGSYCFLHT